MPLSSDITRIGLSDIPADSPLVSYSDSDVAFFTRLSDSPLVGSLQIDCYFFVHCSAGSARFQSGSEQLQLHAGQLFVCPPRSILRPLEVTDDYDCSIVMVSDRLLRTLLYRQLDYWNRAVFIHRVRILTLPPASQNAISGYYSLGQYVIQERRGIFHREILGSFLHIMLLELCAILAGQRPEAKPDTAVGQGAQRLFNNFLELIASSDRKRRTVSDYASALCVTPKYLSAVCRQQSGRTALQWIQDYVTEDVRYCLRSTDLPMKEIAARLGFPNISFFGKYCRQHLGLSPRAYRAADR